MEVYIIRDSFGTTIAITVSQTDAIDLVNKFRGRTVTKGKCDAIEIREEETPFYENRN